MSDEASIRWRTPDEPVGIGFARSRVPAQEGEGEIL
jgi:hypothetical protein